MSARVVSWLSRPGLLKTLASHARLAIRLIREPRVSLLIKAVPVLALAYVLFPLDFMPDFVPIVGEVDDLVVVLIALEAFLNLCPESLVAYHRAAIAERRRYSPIPASGTVLDAEWHES